MVEMVDDLLRKDVLGGRGLFITLIIPTYNAAQHIDVTCASLLAQNECQFEVLFIDAGSTDRTLEIIQSYNEPIFHIQTLSGATLFERINRGIYMAKGSYVAALMPGDTYLYPTALARVAESIVQADLPELFYAASYIESKRGHALHFEPFDDDELKMGREPTLLQSAWVKTTLFKKIGRFSLDYSQRVAFDFFCRLQSVKELKTAFQLRVFVDSRQKEKKGWQYYKETVAIIYRHFGLLAAIKWFFSKTS